MHAFLSLRSIFFSPGTSTATALPSLPSSKIIRSRGYPLYLIKSKLPYNEHASLAGTPYSPNTARNVTFPPPANPIGYNQAPNSPPPGTAPTAGSNSAKTSVPLLTNLSKANPGSSPLTKTSATDLSPSLYRPTYAASTASLPAYSAAPNHT